MKLLKRSCGLPLALGLVLTALALPADADHRKSYQVESQHPYLDWTDQVQEIHHPGARWIRVHFQRLDVEAGYDVVEILDGRNQVVQRLDGQRYNFWSDSVRGDRVRIRLRADHTVNGYGYAIDAYNYEEGPLPTPSVDRLDIQGFNGRPELHPGQSLDFKVIGYANGKPCTLSGGLQVRFQPSGSWGTLQHLGGDRYRFTAGSQPRQNVVVIIELASSTNVNTSFTCDIRRPQPVLARIVLTGLPNHVQLDVGQQVDFSVIGYDQYNRQLSNFSFSPNVNYGSGSNYANLQSLGGNRFRLKGLNAINGMSVTLYDANNRNLQVSFQVTVRRQQPVLTRVELAGIGSRVSVEATQSFDFGVVGYDQFGNRMSSFPFDARISYSPSGNWGSLAHLGNQRYRFTAGRSEGRGIQVTLRCGRNSNHYVGFTLDIVPEPRRGRPTAPGFVGVTDIATGNAGGGVNLDADFISLSNSYVLGKAPANKHQAFLVGDGASQILIYGNRGAQEGQIAAALERGTRLRIKGSVERAGNQYVVVASAVYPFGCEKASAEGLDKKGASYNNQVVYVISRYAGTSNTYVGGYTSSQYRAFTFTGKKVGKYPFTVYVKRGSASEALINTWSGNCMVYGRVGIANGHLYIVADAVHAL